MTVFIEYVIIDNFIIDYLLIKSTFMLSGIKINRKRLIFSALLGAIIALIYPLLRINNLILSAVKILSGLLILLIAGEFNTKRAFYINSIIFFAFVFLFGGTIFGIFYIFNLDYSSEISIALMAIPIYFVHRGIGEIIKYFFQRKNIASLTYKIKLKMFDIEIECNGFLDTGNALFDNNRPIIVCGKKTFIKLLGKNIAKIKLKRIEVISASGKSQNLTFELDELILYIKDKPNIYNNVSVMISNENLGADFDIILNPFLLESKNEDNECLKKIS